MKLLFLLLLLFQLNCIVIDCRGDRRQHQRDTRIYREDNSTPVDYTKANNALAFMSFIFAAFLLIFGFTSINATLIDLCGLAALFWVGYFMAPHNKPLPLDPVIFGISCTGIWTALRLTWLRSLD